jgi:Cu-Zn family superoxide dismutase
MSQKTLVSLPERRRRRRVRILLAVGVVIGLAAVVAVLITRARAVAPAAAATLRLADGRSIGQVVFFDAGKETLVRADLDLPAGSAKTRAFHGFHIHANDDSTNGNACKARATDSPKTWFASADGHYSQAKHAHAEHDGDLTSLYVTASGKGSVEFRTDRFSVSELAGRAIIIHAGADNFGNVPAGSSAQEYTPNSPAAQDVTRRTGNAGDRIACGIIELR